MDLVEVLPQLHMFRFRIGQAYLWRDGADLTLIDAGDIDSAAAIEDAIRTLGLDPAGIRRIVITHGHRDHYGAAQELADRHGAEIIAHALDAPVVRGERPVPEPDLLDWELPLWEHGLTCPDAPPTRVDREVTGGEVLPFGDGARVVHAPGHTGAPSPSICRATACCSPGTPSHPWSGGCSTCSTWTAPRLRPRSGDWPRSRPVPSASVTATRSPRTRPR